MYTSGSEKQVNCHRRYGPYYVLRYLNSSVWGVCVGVRMSGGDRIPGTLAVHVIILRSDKE